MQSTCIYCSRRIFLYLFVLQTSCILHAQVTDYRPFIEEGKTWKVERRSDAVDGASETWYYYFDGDTLVQGRACKRWMCYAESVNGETTLRMVAPIFEENGKVWFYSPKEEKDDMDGEVMEPLLLYDFIVQSGDAASLLVPDYTALWSTEPTFRMAGGYGTLCHFETVLPLTIHGRATRCYCYYSAWNQDAARYDFYLEGVGSTYAPDLNVCTDDPACEYRLVECRVGDTVLYTAEDDPQATVTAIAGEREPVEELPYRPFIEEGKQWTVHRFSYFDTQAHYILETYYFGGDTLVAKQPCKKLMRQARAIPEGTEEDALAYSVYEKGRYVGFFPPGTTQPLTLYDFSARRGDCIRVDGAGGAGSTWSGNFQIWDTFLLEVGGGLFRAQRAALYDNRDFLLSVASYEPDHVWVEGIGSLSSPVKNVGLGETGDYRILVQCSVGEEVIYQNDAYGLLPVLAPTTEPLSNKITHGLFDLSGRRLSARPTKGLYIEDGKVRVGRKE